MAAIIGGGPRKPPRIMRKNITVKQVRKDVRDDEAEKLKREGYEVQAGVLTVNQNHPSNFKPKELPGIANDVESYPCRYCDEKVFLTASGLEKHANESHPLNLEEIVSDINIISKEWKKREFERLRNRERSSMDRLRHEARAHQLVRAVLAGANSATVGGDQYEACAICNMLVNIAHPTAMESHQRAHKKNDELRLQLIDQYGPEAVQRLTCEACSLVFPDTLKLKSHVTSHHTRRKKYICKFCGHISHSMSELNLHKSDVHNYTAWTNVPEFLKARRSFFQYDEGQKRIRRRTAEEMTDDSQTRQPLIGEISEGDTAGRVTCPECGLKLNRPRLLFKHMERVHMKTSFSFMVETGGLPTFGIEVSNSEILFTCCDAKFDNRPEFIAHRRLHIPTHHEEVIVEEPNPEDLPTTSSQADEAVEEVNYPDMVPEDGGVQIILPEGYTIGDTLYYYDEHGTKLQLVAVPDETGHHFIVNPVQEDAQIMEEDEMMQMAGGEEADNGYDQFQMDLGNEWHNMDNMDMILVNEDGVMDGEQEVEDNDLNLNHQILENVEEEEVEEINEGVVEINGQPLFD